MKQINVKLEDDLKHKLDIFVAVNKTGITEVVREQLEKVVETVN